ncbi:MAG: non-canonical purine NTP pyrophosphatase [Terriglobales bacterium]
MKLRFVSRNPYKLAEAATILDPLGIEVVPLKETIEELQTIDASRLVRDKALRAFTKIGRKLFVEHTGLRLRTLNGLPGGLTQVFWDALRAERMSELFGSDEEGTVEAVTDLCYIDGRQFHEFRGVISGRISKQPRGPQDFQWDCVFIPDTRTETFAEMGPAEKNKISMRRKALDTFAEFLRQTEGGLHDNA